MGKKKRHHGPNINNLDKRPPRPRILLFNKKERRVMMKKSRERKSRERKSNKRKYGDISRSSPNPQASPLSSRRSSAAPSSHSHSHSHSSHTYSHCQSQRAATFDINATSQNQRSSQAVRRNSNNTQPPPRKRRKISNSNVCNELCKAGSL